MMGRFENTARNSAYRVVLITLVAFALLLTFAAGPADAAPLAIDSTSPLYQATENDLYNVTLQASGGSAPYTWSMTSGTLPTGLSFYTDGHIEGTVSPASAGLYNFTVQVQDSNTDTASKSFDLRVTDLAITTASLPAGTLGEPYSRTLQATGGSLSYVWYVVEGALPDGLWLDFHSGTISGEPEFAGTFIFIARVKDSTPVEIRKVFAITIGDLAITTEPALPEGKENVYYHKQISAVGGVTPYTWSIASGALPVGVSIGALTGLINGTPQTGDDGIYNFSLELSDWTGLVVSRDFVFPVDADTGVVIGPGTLPDLVAGAFYNTTVSAIGGTPSYTWSIVAGTLPPGISLNTSTGELYGTATDGGQYTFVVMVSDSGILNVRRAYTVDVQAPRILNKGLPQPLPLHAYSETLYVAGGTAPYSWYVKSGDMLSGLTLSPSGVISGNVVTPSIMSFTVQAMDVNGIKTKERPFILGPDSPEMETEYLPEGIVNSPYAASFDISGGSAPYSFSIPSGTLPPGLYLDEDSGHILGYPTTVGTYPFMINVHDPLGPIFQWPMEIAIASTIGVRIETTSLSPASESVYYNQYLQAAGGSAPYTWSYTGTLPSGLSFYADGHIEGTTTPGSQGNYIISVEVQDSLTNTYSKEFTLKVSDLAITSNVFSDGALGVPYRDQGQATGGSAIYEWQVIEGMFPEGLTLHEHTGAIYGTPELKGTYTFIMEVEDSDGNNSSKIFQITISGLGITTLGALPPAREGTYYQENIQAVGGTAPYTWSLAGGSLPSGVSFQGGPGQSALINGTPSVGSEVIYKIFVLVRDYMGYAYMKVMYLPVNAASTLSIATTAIQDAQAGEVYLRTLSATGGTPPYEWSGSLPSGLSLSASGEIQGTLYEAGEYTFSVRVDDSGGNSYTRYYDLAVTGVKVDTTKLPYATFMDSYSTTLTASGGTVPYTWSVSDGRLPTGLALSASTGEISGTVMAKGTEKFEVTVFDSNGAVASRALSLKVYHAQVQSESVPDAANAVFYSKALVSMNGLIPYAWSVSDGALPSGMSLSSGGTLSGTPTVNGQYDFILKLVDGGGVTDYRAFEMAVGDMAITTGSPLPIATVNIYYNQSLALAGGSSPYSWYVTSGVIPGGLSFYPDGHIEGTATIGSVGRWKFTVEAQDSFANTVSKTFELTVLDLTIATSMLSMGAEGEEYSDQIVAVGGSGIYTWIVQPSHLPPGLSLHEHLGTISGTPTAQGTYNFMVYLRDTGGGMVYREFSISIIDLKINEDSPLPDAYVNQYYAKTLTASGGTAPYTWSLAAGVLPASFSFYAGPGFNTFINGTAQSGEEGIYSFSIRVQDSAGYIAVRSFVLPVYPDIGFTPHSVTGGVINRLGLAVPYAPVKATISGGATYETVADGNGEFEFYPVPDGSYRISTRLNGYRFSPVFANVSGADVVVSMQCDTSLWDGAIAPAYYSDKTAPGAPTGFSVTSISSSQVELRWNSPQDNIAVAGIRIYDGVGTHTATAVSDVFRFSGLDSVTEYCFHVSAFDGAGNESAQSAQECATTLP